MAGYRILIDDDFLIQAFRKYRRQHGARYVLLAVKSVGAALLLAVSAFGVVMEMWGLVAFLVPLVFLMFSGHLIDFWRMKRRFRKSPFRNDEAAITLTPDGLHTVSPKSESRQTWAVFTRARRFSDGFILFQGPGLFNWLPDAALTDGTPHEVDAMVRDNVKDYKVVEGSLGPHPGKGPGGPEA